MTIKRMTTTQIAAAMATTDEAVDKPSRVKPGSMKSRLEALEVGGIACKARRPSLDMSISDWLKEGPIAREALRNSLTSTVAKTREITGGTYSIEVADLYLPSGVVMVAVVSRTA